MPLQVTAQRPPRGDLASYPPLVTNLMKIQSERSDLNQVRPAVISLKTMHCRWLLLYRSVLLDSCPAILQLASQCTAGAG